MLTRLLLTATACLAAAACTSALSLQPASLAGSAVDGVYSGVGVQTKSAAQPFCEGTTQMAFSKPKLTVQNGNVIWPASGTVTAAVPVAADGTFYSQYGLNILSGKITGNRMDAFSDTLSCGTKLTLEKTG
ncbi:MAG: hypothetical protein J2P47_07160 [Acetobacteraceae bacterium]|nr:hypothetical protein [Acetobacteraceae bacterium]